MAISTAVQRGDWIYVYDENGSCVSTISGDLHGFTGSSVSVRRNGWIYVYDEHGSVQNTYAC